MPGFKAGIPFVAPAGFTLKGTRAIRQPGGWITNPAEAKQGSSSRSVL
jgi:hypothetical protein